MPLLHSFLFSYLVFRRFPRRVPKSEPARIRSYFDSFSFSGPPKSLRRRCTPKCSETEPESRRTGATAGCPSSGGSSGAAAVEDDVGVDYCRLRCLKRRVFITVKSPFKVESLVTKMEFHIKKSPFKELKCADGGHSLNRDFTVQ